ncbi:MAG TPA: class I SAM-dependent methyltransferase [Ruminococcaceae bacterium]|nr:class I SAM-dependent methyltransferase [Oscillospiraceae bacterium]
MDTKWDAQKYTKDFSFVHQYGNDVLKLIEIKPHFSALDLGCGNGALTKQLSAMGLHAMGMDASAELLEVAHRQYPDFQFFHGDATDFMLPAKVDIIFSNAVFHWIKKEKQLQMLQCVYRALNDKGQFVFEFGGSGNNALIHQALKVAFQEQGLSYQMPFYFPTIGEYASLLEQAGFKVTYAVLFDRLTTLNGPNGLSDWIQMFIKDPFASIEAERRKKLIQRTTEQVRDTLYHEKKWYADYVRIRMKAIKPTTR